MLAITRLGAAFRAGLAARNQARRIPHSAWKDALREVVVLQKTENALKAEISTLLARGNLESQMLALDDNVVAPPEQDDNGWIAPLPAALVCRGIGRLLCCPRSQRTKARLTLFEK